MSYDLVIKGGTVIDGTGRPAFQSDVAVQAGRIVSVGRVDAGGAEVLDAEGHVVAPGFIDGHTHMDAQVMWDPLGTCSCWHGVTTVVMGNCGFTLAPARPDARALVVRNLERAEDIAPEAMSAGIDWRWETFPEYLDVLDSLPMGINYASNIGHSALRTWAMGERAFEETANDEDRERMRRQLTSALGAGAIGFTTSLTESHATSDGRPVASRVASWDEVRDLVEVMSKARHGVFEIAPGPIANPENAIRYERIYQLAIDSGVPTTFGITCNAEGGRRILRDMQAAVDRGATMFAQSHSRGVKNVMSLKARLPFDSLPEWEELRKRPIEDQLIALRDPVCRRRLVAIANGGDYDGRIGTQPRKPAFETLTVLDSPIPPYSTMSELAKVRNMDPMELMVDLIVDSDGDQFFAQPLVDGEESFLLEGMSHPLSVMTFSDSGAHVSQIMDASIQTHLLAYWVRERQAFTLEEAVHKITGMPARTWGFTDRGLVREGMIADINVFDPARIGPEMPKVANDLPGGAMRLLQKSQGILATLVAGAVVHRDGIHSGALPGKLLRAGLNHGAPIASR